MTNENKLELCGDCKNFAPYHKSTQEQGRCLNLSCKVYITEKDWTPHQAHANVKEWLLNCLHNGPSCFTRATDTEKAIVASAYRRLGM